MTTMRPFATFCSIGLLGLAGPVASAQDARSTLARGGYELDAGNPAGDPEFDCFDPWLVVDQFGSPFAPNSWSFDAYDVENDGNYGGVPGTYTGVNVMCSTVDQFDPGNAWPILDPGTPGVDDSIMEFIELNN